MKLVTAETMQALDRYTIDTVGIPGVVLMEVAGRSCAHHTAELMTDKDLDTALILCGPGNNGGDGFVVARHLCDWGFDAVVALFCKRRAVKGDALINLKALEHFPVPVIEVQDDIPEDILFEAAAGGLIVDALFGTGLQRPVQGRYARAIEAVNGLRCPVVAVDIPSGICSDTGRILGTALDADLTVTFGAAKVGHFTYPGRAHCGSVEVESIGIPDEAIDEAPGAVLLNPGFAAAAFPYREPNSFKNHYGHLLVVGGLTGKGGAALLTAMGAVRAGSGLVTVATDSEAQAHIEGRFPELMVEGPFTIGDAGITVDEDAFGRLLEGKTAVAVGPGLSTLAGAEHILKLALAANLPTVIDADALNLLSSDLEGDWGIGDRCVLTPHPGEAGRLLVRSTAAVQQNRVQAVTELSDQWGAVVVLKGAGTLVAAPDNLLGVNTTGGPALATAGSGDVLTGMTGALLARGLPPWASACASVYLHGMAGDSATERLNVHSVSASDVLDSLPEAIASVVSL